NDFVYTEGGDDVATYRVREDGFATFHFCDFCGVRIGTAVSHPQYGEFFNVSIGALEGVDAEELIDAPVHWIDGLNERWGEPPAETRHL
ncbi:MAG: GFA family protein, partial [Pseudomonadota bacterium]